MVFSDKMYLKFWVNLENVYLSFLSHARQAFQSFRLTRNRGKHMAPCDNSINKY